MLRNKDTDFKFSWKSSIFFNEEIWYQIKIGLFFFIFMFIYLFIYFVLFAFFGIPIEIVSN